MSVPTRSLTSGEESADWDTAKGTRRGHRSSSPTLHPLAVVCALQAIVSLTLVWSNTAFSDEADYLWLGHLEIAHWLHGAAWPAQYADHVLSGSPIIYPPLGAMADGVGGLAGARILSLIFMLAATVLLYRTTSILVSRPAAVAAAAFWALSEPALRLAFATFDPLSVLLTAVSAWLVVESTHRVRRAPYVLASAAALALANVTAYSGIVIDPVVIAFALLVWLHNTWARQALAYIASFIGCGAALFALLMTAGHSWSGIEFTVLSRSGTDHQGVLLVLHDIWGYSGLVLIVTIVGALRALAVETRQRRALLVLLGLAALAVPAAQVYEQTGWSLDKHLAYGIWFAAIVAGYAFAAVIRWLPETSRLAAVISSVIALGFLAATGWQSAWTAYHEWPNTSAFTNSLSKVATGDRGLVYAVGQEHIGEYYTARDIKWTRWTTALSLRPPSTTPAASYYESQLKNYETIALFYPTSFSSAPELSQGLLFSAPSANTRTRLLRLVGAGSAEPGLPALTEVLESDHDFAFRASGPYNSADSHGFFVIWQRVSTP